MTACFHSCPPVCAGTVKPAGASFDDFADLEDDFDDDESGQVVQRRGLAGERSAQRHTGECYIAEVSWLV